LTRNVKGTLEESLAIMEINMKTLTSICLLAALFAPCMSAAQEDAPPQAAPPAVAQAPSVPPPPPPPPPPPYVGKWWKNSAIVRDLALNDDQIQKLEETYLRYQARLAELRDELRTQESQLKNLLQGDKLDDAALAAQTEKAIAARGNLERENAAMTLALRKLLSGEQWKKLQTKKEQLLQPPLPPAPPPPPPPPPPPGDTSGSDEKVYSLRQNPQIKPPQAIHMPLPEYTPEAKAAKVEGVITLQAVILKDGTVSEIKVLQGLGYGLDAAAVDTVRSKWRFRPATLDNKPVNVRANVEVTFRLY
jgi:TonB family protein